jgi:hypothetical protein
VWAIVFVTEPGGAQLPAVIGMAVLVMVGAHTFKHYLPIIFHQPAY